MLSFGKGLSVCCTSLLKTLGKENFLKTSNFSFFPTMFCTLKGDFLIFSLDLKLSSANSFSSEETKLCCLGKG